MTKKKLLVTGSCGFKFSNFIRYVRKNKTEYDIVSIDAIKDPKYLNNIYANKGHLCYIGDITDTRFVNNVFNIEKPDIVIHGAEESSSPHEDTIKTNILGTQILLNAAKDFNVEKFVLSSNSKVYGDLKDEYSFNETSNLKPNNTYAVSKMSAELLVKTFGLNYNIIRSSNCYGPRQNINNLIPYIITTLLNTKDNFDVMLYGKGEHVREWLHVQDLCQAILDILENGKDNEIYNISSKQEFSNIEVFQEICNVFKNEYNLDCYNRLQFINKNSDHKRVLNNEKLLSIGWKPSWKFKDSISYVVKWYNDNQWYI